MTEQQLLKLKEGDIVYFVNSVGLDCEVEVFSGVIQSVNNASCQRSNLSAVVKTQGAGLARTLEPHEVYYTEKEAYDDTLVKMVKVATDQVDDMKDEIEYIKTELQDAQTRLVKFKPMLS